VKVLCLNPIGSLDYGLQYLPNEVLVCVSGYHKFVSYPFFHYVLLFLYLFVNVLGALGQLIVSGLDQANTSVRSIDGIAAGFR